MAKVSERIIALVAAIVFFATSVGVTVLVIMQSNDQKNQQATLDSQLEDAQTAANETQPEVEEEQPKEGALQGTKLADFTPMGEVSELKIVDLVEGTGAVVKEGGNVTAHYTGAYSVNGEIFESSKDSGRPLDNYSLNDLIAGWAQGIPGMKEGGKRRLIIPGSLAYGEAPEGYTPGSGGRPLGTLVFDIELISTN